MKFKKKVVVKVAITLVLVCGLAYFYWPLSFGDSFDYILVGYMESAFSPYGEPTSRAKEFSFSSQDAELQQIKDTLKKYTIHRAFTSPFKGATIHYEGDSQTFNLGLSNGDFISITKSPYILYGSQVYRVGYWGNSKVVALIDELKNVLAIE